jgi:acyl-CoA dehydrogenase
MNAAHASALERLAALAEQVGRESERELGALDETAAARAALTRLARAGLLAWTVPQSEGGADTGGLSRPDRVSVRALCAVRAALAQHSGVLDVMFVMQGLGSNALCAASDGKLRREHLSKVASGARIAAFALTEPRAGSNPAQIETRAERTAQGWKLSGHKTFISNAGLADFYTVLARTSAGAKSAHTMFLVPADAKGSSVERFEVLAPHPIGDLTLRDVEVPPSHQLGEVGAGLDLALSVLQRFRTSVAAAANGFARRALDESIAHLGSREQFGKRLASFQSLRFDVAEMDARLRAAELLVDEAARAVDADAPAVKEVARAKWFATENASWVCDRAVQHHGGLGVKRGQVVERLYREVRALRIYEGTSEIQKLILSNALFPKQSD